MSSLPLSAYELESKLNDESIATCFGISDNSANKWSLAVYIGNSKFVILYERGKGIEEKIFEILKSLNMVSKSNLQTSNDLSKFSYSISDFYSKRHIQFDIYNINIFDTSKANSIKPNQFIETLKANLIQINSFQISDAIVFHRGLYSHHAVLTDITRMTVTHRWGEPENPSGFCDSAKSLIGLPTDKASVSEDFLIEVAGYRSISKGNHLYDKHRQPKPTEEIVESAKNKLGEKGYSLSSKNCQHFVSDIRNGTEISPEVNDVITGAKYATIGLVTALTAAFAYSSYKNSSKNKDENKKYYS